MISQKGKFFWKINDLDKNITCLQFDDKEEYYSFLKKCHQKGFRQVIVTSEIMVKLIQYFVLERELKVYNIEFMESDEELESEIDDLLSSIDKKTIFVNKLIEKINFLSEESSIDIKRVYFKGRDDKSAINCYLQSNGIISVDESHYSSLTNEISNLIARCLF